VREDAPRRGETLSDACHTLDVSGQVVIPDPAVVVLIGASGSGKSTWAARYRTAEVVSSDALRAVVGSGESDIDASTEAFALLDAIVAGRLRRGLTTVIDTLGLEPARRGGYLAAATEAGLPAVAVLFPTEAAVCRRRNRLRERPVPAPALDAQLARMRDVPDEVASEGWDVVVEVSGPVGEPALVETGHSPGSQAAATLQAARPRALGFVLQISQFPWGDDPAGWLAATAAAAADAGFEGIALMDHLIQIPQVGRPWDPIPEPWVSLGMLAGLAHASGAGLRLGTLVTPVTFRPAGVVAKAAATLDVLTGGRAFVGVGAGWWEREHLAYGLSLPPVRERMDALERGIETMRALWSSGTRAYDGDRVSLPETTAYPRPVGPLPIIVGGGGERRTLRIAAELGDACNVRADLDTVDRKIAALRGHCKRVGRDPDEVAVTVLDLPVVGSDRDTVAATVERLRGRTPAAAYARRHYAGTPRDQIGRYRLLADKGVQTVFVAFPDLAGPEEVNRFAPIAAAFR
jgi:alkanesulfonate monooxygenase SsuD/methylene tetrahydromethanopterin reductase-like flavin-dependent oxidoreductase (luciferase family)/predicted kinase